jgi:hypothetical protein
MKIRNKQTGQIIEVTEDQLADYGLDTMAKGGMIKRADGSYSRRGLWDNIRANKGSGKKPTKAMLAQERKIRAAEKAYGGYMDMGGYMNPYMAYGGYLPMAQDGIGMVRPSAAEIAQRSQNYAPVQETSMLQPVVIEDDSQPYSVIQRTLPEGVDYSSQVPFNTGVVQVGNVPVQVAMKQEAAKSTSKNLGLVDYLASQGLAFDKESRKKYAKELGIKDYDFSGTKNTELLKKIKENISKINKKGYSWSNAQSPNYGVTGGAEPRTPVSVRAKPPVAPPPPAPAPPLLSMASPVVQSPYSASAPITMDPYYNAMQSDATRAYIDPRMTNPFLPTIPNLQYITQQGNPELARYATSNPQNLRFVQGRKEYGGYMAQGGINNPGFRALPDYVQQNIIDNMAYGGCKECGGKMQGGGTAKPSYNFPALMEKPTAMDSAVYRSNFNQMLKQDPYAVSQYQKMQKYGIPPTLDNETYTKALMWQNAYEDALSKLKKKESGGKLPKEVLRARLESHMSSGQAQDYLNTYGMGGYLDEAGDGKWMQKATASIKRRGTEGVCTGSKFGGPGCPPGSKRYNLAKTFRKMAKSKKEEGGYAQGGEYEMTDAEIAKLRSMGYKIKEV